MLFSFLFLLAQFSFGFLVFGFFDPQKRFSPFERVLASVLLGGLFSGFLVLVLALWWQSLSLAILVFILFSLLIAAFRFLTHWPSMKIDLSGFSRHLALARLRFPYLSRRNAWVVFLLALMVLYWLLLSTVLFRAADGTLRGTLVGWGDIALHLNIIERMATAQPFVIDHPVAAGVHLVYPFLINFLSAIFRFLGLDMVLAFEIPLFIFGTLSLLLVFALADRVLKSKNMAILVLILVILGSGFGFKVLFEDLQKGYQKNGLVGLTAILADPPHEYTHLDNRTGGKPAEKDTNDNIVWIVPVISFLSHQRSFPLGLAVFSFLLLGLWLYGQDRQFWRFGIVAGLLPLSHAHSFLALFFLTASLFWFFLPNRKAWFKFGLLTALLALPQIIYLVFNEAKLVYFKAGSQVLSSGFIRPWFGWMTTDSNAFVFWSKNFGLIFWGWLLILVLAAVLFLVPRFRGKIKERLSMKFLFASLVLFILSNLFLFQPWPFDNNKILFYWWLLAIIFGIGPLLGFLWRQRVWGRLVLIFFIFLAILAGSLDFAARLARPRNSNGYYGYSDSNKDKVAAAAWIRDNTRPNDLFLTSRDVDPLPVFLAGRPVYLGFEGWLWTEGLDYSRNRRVAESVVARDLKKACDEKIAYILLDDDLRRDYPRVNLEVPSIIEGEENLLEKTQVVFVSGSRQILKLICP